MRRRSFCIEDWIGLKTLDRAGRVKYISVSENHIKMSKNDMIKYIVPYLKGFGRLKRVDEVQKLNKQRLLGREG